MEQKYIILTKTFSPDSDWHDLSWAGANYSLVVIDLSPTKPVHLNTSPTHATQGIRASLHLHFPAFSGKNDASWLQGVQNFY